MELQLAQRRLARIWFIFGGILFLLIFMQTMFGKFEDKSDEAWSWFFPNIIPTLSLMISVFVFQNKKPQANKSIDKFYFQLAFWLSLFYLTTILVTILSQPFVGSSIISLMHESNLYLGPFQGLVTAALGSLFIKSK